MMISNLPTDQAPSFNKHPKYTLAVKIYLVVTILMILGSSITALTLYHLNLDVLREAIAGKLASIATMASTALEPEKLKLIHAPSDEGTANYRELQLKLQQIQQTCHDKLRYLYVIAKKDNFYVYVLDATPVGAKDHSTVGDRFPIEEYPAALHGFRYPTVDPKPLPDYQFGGVSQSGYAPIRDASGKTVAIIGIDMDVSKIKADEQKNLAAAVETILISLLIALLLGIAFSSYLTQPIIKVIDGIQKIAGGNFDTQINIGRRDELGMLAESFNQMAVDLKKARFQLTIMNTELEKKVVERTTELSETNQAICEILDGMEEGVLTINRDLCINPQYSHFTELIFESAQIAGRRIDDILFQELEENECKTQLVDWLSLIFELPVVIWSNLEQVQPVTELPLSIKLSNGKVKHKDLQLMFRPVFHQESGNARPKVSKIMVIIQDNTEKKNLKREVETKAKEYQDNINDIIEVIQLDQDLFIMFINDCQEQLGYFEPQLIKLQNDPNNLALINDLLRITHTLKGNATQFKLERIASKIHEIESIFSKIRDREIEFTDQLLDEIFDKLDRVQQFLREIEEVYNRFILGKKRDVEIRSEERGREEVSIIRVKTEELDRLITLIQKGSALETNRNNPETLQKILMETESGLTKMRRIPIGRLFARFPRMVKEISAELGKDIDLHLKGEEIVVDRAIFEKLGDPLIHILRNALDHGIEPPEERTRLGKPVKGNIDIRVELKIKELIISIRDDGRGIDLEYTREKAIEKGFITKEEASRMSVSEITDLLFIPGFTTNDQLTEISGQGVGLDVVKSSMLDLKGEIQLTSVKNQGTQFVLTIPTAG